MKNQILEKMIIDLKSEIKINKVNAQVLESRIQKDIKNRDILNNETIEKQYVLALLENDKEELK